MRPEQATGQAVDFRTDQFSFGLVVYELASGQRAFARPTVETLAAIVREEPEAITVKIPPPLQWIVDRCLTKEPIDKFRFDRGTCITS